jgi:hypothetical protein
MVDIKINDVDNLVDVVEFFFLKKNHGNFIIIMCMLNYGNEKLRLLQLGPSCNYHFI